MLAGTRGVWSIQRGARGLTELQAKGCRVIPKTNISSNHFSLLLQTTTLGSGRKILGLFQKRNPKRQEMSKLERF